MSEVTADEWVELPVPETIRDGDVVVTAVNRTKLQQILDRAEAGESMIDMVLHEESEVTRAP